MAFGRSVGQNRSPKLPQSGARVAMGR
jgi:hypothetical protein